MKKQLVLIYSKLQWKSCDYLYRFSIDFILSLGEVWLSDTLVKLVHAIRDYPRHEISNSIELLFHGMLVHLRLLPSILIAINRYTFVLLGVKDIDCLLSLFLRIDTLVIVWGNLKDGPQRRAHKTIFHAPR